MLRVGIRGPCIEPGVPTSMDRNVLFVSHRLRTSATPFSETIDSVTLSRDPVSSEDGMKPKS